MAVGLRKQPGTTLFWTITPYVVVIPYRRYGQPIGPIIKGEECKKNYHYSLRQYPEERSSQLLHGGSLKLRKKTALENCVYKS
jgi:hypothetical protein